MERITSIKVRRRSDNSKGIVISVEVVLYYGVKLFAVTKQFQAKIKEKIEYMTAMKVNNVNVSIRSLAVKKWIEQLYALNTLGCTNPPQGSLRGILFFDTLG